MAFDFSKFKLDIKDLNLDALPASRVSLPQWARLEARPRGTDLIDSLKAQVRDPLWLLCRQWQMGEFEGDDCGTPVYSDLDYDCSSIQSQQLPLNPLISAQPVINENDPGTKSLDVRIQMAEMWIRIISSDAQLKLLIPKFTTNPLYRFKQDTGTPVDEGSFGMLEFFKDRYFDGFVFYKDTKRFNSFTTPQRTLLNAKFILFTQWYTRTYFQTEKSNNWNNSSLEYQYTLNVTEKVEANTSLLNTKSIVVDEFYDPVPEWYHLKIKNQQSKASTTLLLNGIKTLKYAKNSPGVKKLIPASVRFAGMPESRFWAFEEGGTNLAAVGADTLDLGRIALLEFGLIYSNDWMMMPIKASIGSMVQIRSLNITDSFGKVQVIKAVDQGIANTWDKWAYFSLDMIKDGNLGKADSSLPILGVIPQPIQGEPIEEVVFQIDEMANLVWAIEKTVQTPGGKPREGRSMQKEKKREKGTDWKYEPQSQVPLHWIPFSALQSETKQWVYRRGKMLSEAGEKIYPQTSLIRKGLSSTNQVEQVFDIYNHELCREGLQLKLRYNYGRWLNGEVYLWKAIQKETGGGEGNSGLAFDQLVNFDLNNK